MNKWLKIMLITSGFMLLAAGMLAPIYAIFVLEIGGSILDASGAWAAFALTAGILMVFLGKWEDRTQHYSKTLVLGYALQSIGFLGYLFIQTPTHLFIVQIILGISFAFIAPAYDALYSSLLDKGQFAAEWGAWEAMSMIVGALAAVLGGLVVTYFGFQVLFMGMFALALVATGISLTLVKNQI